MNKVKVPQHTLTELMRPELLNTGKHIAFKEAKILAVVLNGVSIHLARHKRLNHVTLGTSAEIRIVDAQEIIVLIRWTWTTTVLKIANELSQEELQ